MYSFLGDNSPSELHYLSVFSKPRVPLLQTVPLTEAQKFFENHARDDLQKTRSYASRIFLGVVTFFLEDLEDLDSISQASTGGAYRKTTTGKAVVSKRLTAVYRDGVEYFEISNEVKEVVPRDTVLLQPIAHSDLITQVTISTVKAVGKNLGIPVE